MGESTAGSGVKTFLKRRLQGNTGCLMKVEESSLSLPQTAPALLFAVLLLRHLLTWKTSAAAAAASQAARPHYTATHTAVTPHTPIAPKAAAAAASCQPFQTG